jgi:hypothetical protein
MIFINYFAKHLFLIWCFATLLVFNPIEQNLVSAQSVLERLENQIRQNVNPSQEGGQPHRAPATRPPTAQSANQPVGAQPPANNSQNMSQAGDRAQQGYLGATVDDKKDRGRGVRINEVRSGGPADRAGLRKQDLIVGLAGVRIRQMSDLTDVLALYMTDDTVEFDIIRNDKPQKIKVTLGHRPDATVAVEQGVETIPLPPGELIQPQIPPEPELITPKVNETPTISDREKIKQLQGRIVELEQRVKELERELSEAQKKK